MRDRFTGGVGWRGKVTYTSKYMYKGSGQKANNISYWEESSSYDATVLLDGKVNTNGVPIATVKGRRRLRGI